MSLQRSKTFVNTTSSARASSSSTRTRRRQCNPSTSSDLAMMTTESSTSTIQMIYDISKDVFAAATPGFMPLPSDTARLVGLLSISLGNMPIILVPADGLSLEDVGLNATMPYFKVNPQGHPAVTYLHFACSPSLSFGVFCFPQSAMIPLHDHPGMTVFSKILYGSMHIKSYDWVIDPPAGNKVTRVIKGARLAKMKTDAIFDASSETVVLYPEDGGNLHCLTAMSPCAMLDVMGPPYSEGRDCSYFSSRVGPANGDDEHYAWLKQVSRTFKMNTFHMRPNIRK